MLQSILCHRRSITLDDDNVTGLIVADLTFITAMLRYVLCNLFFLSQTSILEADDASDIISIANE